MANGNNQAPVDQRTERLKLILSTVTALAATIGPIALAYIQYKQAVAIKIQHKELDVKIDTASGKIDDAAVKAEVAAAKAEVAAVKADAVQETTLKTRVDLSEWKSSYTKDPSDMEAARVAREKLEKLEGTAAAASPPP